MALGPAAAPLSPTLINASVGAPDELPISRLPCDPGAGAPVQVRAGTPDCPATPKLKLREDGPRKLFAMGLLTNLLNPKIAMLYLALLPQFIDPASGSVLTQSIALGAIQIAISVSVNAMIALAAGSIALFLAQRPTWMLVQRYLMGTVLAGLAVRMAFEARKA